MELNTDKTENHLKRYVIEEIKKMTDKEFIEWYLTPVDNENISNEEVRENFKQILLENELYEQLNIIKKCIK